MLRIVLSLLLTFSLSSCASQLAEYEDTKGVFDNLHVVDLSSVFKIQCGSKVGTAFSLEGNKIVTAAHVVKDTAGCSLDQELLTPLYYDDKSDYYIFKNTKLNSNEKNCNGFKEGQLYFSVGWAYGNRKVIEFYIATDVTLNEKTLGKGDYIDFRILLGPSYPGMSGAPIFDLNGDVVGILNGFTKGHKFTFATPLSKTKMCNLVTPVGLEPTT